MDYVINAFDGNTSYKSECLVFDNGHQFNYDPADSGIDRSVFSCSCGARIVEHEDAGTGA